MESQEPVMTCEDIESILPHRYPFLLVDRVDEILPGPDPKKRLGRKIRAVKNVTVNEPFFQGHFPSWKVMPGVLQLETMAQAAALGAIIEGDGSFDVAIVACDKARFRQPVVPGDTLEIVAEIVKDRGMMFSAKGEIYVKGKLVSEAELMARVFPGGKEKSN